MDNSLSSRFTVGCLWRCCTSLTNFLFLAAFITPLTQYWEGLTPCFQRQSIVIAMTLIYWQFKDIVRPSYLIESLQFLITFVLTEKLNAHDQDIMDTCLQPHNVFTRVIYTIYFFLFGYYIGTIIVFTFLLLGAIIYDCYYSFVILPKILQERSIRGKEFEELEIVSYTKPSKEASEQELICSICLTEFQEQEKIINLPICTHHFHKKCIQEWLKEHKECPYCRADIRANLKLWKVNGKKNFKEVKINKNQRKKTIEMVNSTEPRTDLQPDGLVYIEFQES